MNRFKSPWTITAVLAAILLLLFAVGYWRGGGSGVQVQIPMFYDAHYLFPRAWTQEQEAPGVPAPAPVGFYGKNQLSQTFIAGSDQLSMIELWLQGAPYAIVDVTLQDDGGNVYAGHASLPEQPEGGYYRFAFPPINDARGREFRLTLAAPSAAADQPAIAHAIGGDRLGGAMRINEYGRPGNIEMQTYIKSGLFHWPLQAIGQQLLPDPFRLRLQQYKPTPLKGAIFPVLLMLTAVLSIVFLFLAAPSTRRSLKQAAGWAMAGLLFAFLAWQLLDGRMKLPFGAAEMTAVAPSSLPIALEEPRATHDLTAVLWTTERLPEKRFFDTLVTDDGYPAIAAPPDSTIEYAMTMPPNGRLRVGAQAAGVGQTWFTLLWNDRELDRRLIDEQPVWGDMDLSPYAGQDGVLTLQTQPESGRPAAHWLMPQLTAQSDWLALAPPDEYQPSGYRFGEFVELVGYALQADGVTLYWRTERPFLDDAVVFVHLLDENGEMIAQHDGRPVGNSYPTTVWPADLIIADFHPLEGNVENGRLAVGLYDPASGARWSALAPDGTPSPDNSAALIP